MLPEDASLNHMRHKVRHMRHKVRRMRHKVPPNVILWRRVRRKVRRMRRMVSLTVESSAPRRASKVRRMVTSTS